MRPLPSRNRAGFTLLEMLIALTIFGVVFGAAISMMAQQVKTTSRSTDASTALQNLRFSFDEIERDVRAAGIGLGDGQPTLVFADSNLIVFNGNYMSNTKGDEAAAVYVDTLQSDSATTVLPKSRQITLPGTSVHYPDTTYKKGADVGTAETIMFFFRRDSSSTAPGVYILYRQVNDLAPEVIARDMMHNGTRPFFQYIRLTTPTTGLPRLDSILPSALPLRHSVPMHLTAGDSGHAAIIDSVRAVRVSFTATNGVNAGPRQVRRSISRLLRLPNAGLEEYSTCGSPPLGASALTATPTDIGGSRVVELTWNASGDQNGGERDVIRYVIYRSISPAAFGDAYYTVASGTGTSYVWDDYAVEAGITYTYAVASEDCTPAIGSKTGSVNATP